MSLLVSLVHQFTAHVLAQSELYYWLWLTVSILAIDLFYRVSNRAASESFWKHSSPWRIYTHPSAILDYKYILFQKFVVAFIIAPIIVSELALGRWGSTVLTHQFGPGPGWTAGPASLIVFGLTGFVLLDTGQYISHYIQHKVPFFWEFHKIHHAAEVLTPVTAFRVHPVENILDGIIQGPLQALGLAAFYYLYGSNQTALSLIWIGALFPLYYLVGSLRHSHIWFSFGPLLEHILSSPAQHQIHHSRAPRHLDTNFSRYFSFLDWIAGTLYVPKGEEEIDFGLAEGADPELSDVWSLYWVPVKRAFRRLRHIRHNATPALTSDTDQTVVPHPVRQTTV